MFVLESLGMPCEPLFLFTLTVRVFLGGREAGRRKRFSHFLTTIVPYIVKIIKLLSARITRFSLHVGGRKKNKTIGFLVDFFVPSAKKIFSAITEKIFDKKNPLKI